MEKVDDVASGPLVLITNPANSIEIQTPDFVVNIIGTAKSDSGIQSVDWVNDRGGRGSASGTESWQTGDILLHFGRNNITITATDSIGQSNSESIMVEREYTSAIDPDNPDSQIALYSHKRVHRVYKTMNPNLPRRTKRRLPKRVQQPTLVETRSNVECSPDFMSESPCHGRRLRTLNVPDEAMREALNFVIDTSIPGDRVVQIQDRLIEWRGKPDAI